MSDWLHQRRRSLCLDLSRFAACSFFLCVLCAGAILLLMPSVAAEEHSPGPLVLELSLDGEVEPILATYIDEGLADAAKRHAALVLITMDTPGGLSDSMKDMIQHILASPVPVAVYVSPTGGRGASAGFYILLSADIAAMAPGTHAGAASPIKLMRFFERRSTRMRWRFCGVLRRGEGATRNWRKKPSPSRKPLPRK